MTGLYIHIPFCSGKCGYCDFVSFAGKSGFYGRYLDALEAEMSLYGRSAPDTLYIGGGTPSELDAAQLRRLLAAVERRFIPVREFAESTFEANPESLSRDRIMTLRQFGINRVSMGLQSFDSAVLARLGRRHTAEKFVSAWRDLRAAGFKNLNVDIMCGIPGQGMASFRETLAEAIKLDPEHVSLYGLQVETDSRFGREGVAADDDAARAMFDYARETLSGAGYVHYEISNFAKPGRESAHNINYWDGGDYIGIGCAAASYLGGVRKTNTDSLELYLAGGGAPLSCCEELKGREKTGELLLLGLRKLSGVKLTGEMLKEFSAELESLRGKGLLDLSGGVARLTPEGIYVSNEVFREFVPPWD